MALQRPQSARIPPHNSRLFGSGWKPAHSYLAVDVAVAEQYAALRLHLRRARAVLADHDLWIAATALAHDLTLVSRDRHFDRVPGLRLHRPDPA